MLTRTFGCQVCCTTYRKLLDFKKHVSSSEHQENMKKMFPKDKMFKGIGHLPFILFLDSTINFKHPIIGLSQLTVCYSPGQTVYFYLCHVCEEKCSPARIKSHFYNGDHNSSYLSYTNPDILNFSWIPSATITSPLRSHIKREVDKNGSGVLQILDLPEKLLMKADKGTYSEVMDLFSENENLSKNIAVVIPRRKTIQLYLKSDTRKHPLLGMQHIVECVCAGQKWKRHYLCTLCRLTLTSSMIIKHVLSFDHIYSYFEAWHPSTLMSKQCYTDNSKSFSSRMLDLAHQSQNILGTANSDIKEVILEPEVFTSVKLACYDKALKELESTTKSETEHSLITSIKPGNKLEPSPPTPHSSVNGSTSVTISAPKSTSTNIPKKVEQEKSQEKQKGESVSTECGSEQPFYVLRCQDCSMIFQEESLYSTHVVKMKHQKMFKKIFKVDAMPGPAGFCRSPVLYSFVKDTLKRRLPVVGASLIVTILCTKASDEPLCICFACEECFLEKSLRPHMTSSKHLIKTLLYQNPWRLPFAWDQWEGLKLLQTRAAQEEKERGRSERMLKILDVPQSLLRNLMPPCYPSVMDKLVLYHAVLKRSVPPRETHRKLDQNDRFPLLGKQFLVKYAVNTNSYQHQGWQFVCLLCQRTLSAKEHDTHIFSREHVVQFLESFHPGSLSSHSENKEILLDLAKQAARIHPVSSEQEILLEQPIWEPCPYKRLTRILASAKRRIEDSPLEPLVTIKKKLVPREKIEEMPKNHVKEGVAEGMTHKCPENSEAASGNISVQSVGAESDPKAEVALETCLLVKETSTEEPTKLTVVNQSQDTSERESRPQYTETEIVSNQGKNHRKRQISQCEESKDTCLIEAVGGVIPPKKQRLSLNEEIEDMLEDGKGGAAAAETGKQLQQFFSKWECPADGSNVLYECWCEDRDPIYLCEQCSLKVKEEDIISHVSDSTHQKMNRLAVDLDEDVYNSLLNQNFKTGLQIMKAHVGQWEDGSELPSTSGVPHVATSVATARPPEVNCSTDDQQVMDMEVEDSVELFSSATAARTVFSPGGLDCPVPLGVPMTVTQDITVNKMDPTPSSCFSATSSGTAESVSSSETVRSTLVTSSCTPTNIKCHEAAFKSPAATSCATGDLITSTTVLTDTADTFTSAPSKPMGEVSSSSANKSNTTKSSPNQLDVKAEAGPKVRSTTYKSADVSEDPFKTTTSYRDLSETASTTTVVSKTEVVSSVPTSKPQPQNTEAMDETVYMKNSVSTNNVIAPNVGKSYPSAAPTTPVFVRSQHKTPPTEPSLTQDRKTKLYISPCPIGVDQLIKVICEGKRQTYCQLCMVRLMHSSHTFSFQHQYEYVKLMYPWWTPKQSNIKEELHTKVAEIAKAEKAKEVDANSRPFKWIKVNLDVYQELAALPEAIAVQRLVEMLKQKDSWNSPSTTDPGKNTRQPVVSASPSEFTSPDFDMDSPLYEIAGPSTRNQTEKGNQCELKTVRVQKAELRVESPSTTLDPPTTSAVSVRPPIQTPDIGQETPVHRKQQESSVPALQDAHISTAGSKETPSSKSVSSDALVRPSALSQKANHVPRLSRLSPGQREAFEAQDTIRIGEMDPGPSNLSKSLSVIVTEPFIGLGSIWECRGMSNKPLKTVYLCECCELKLLNSDIGQHMISIDHQRTYMLSHPKYRKFMYWWSDMDLKEHQKEELVKDIVSYLRERESSMDAQSVLLHFAAYDYVCKKPFIKALNLVQTIQSNYKLNMPIRPAVTLPSQNASAHTASQMSPVSTGPVHEGKGHCRKASPSQTHTQQQPQQVTTLSFVQNSTIPQASAWFVPAVQPVQVLWTNPTQPVVASNTVYVAPPVAGFSQNYNPAAHVLNQYNVIIGQSNSNTHPTAATVQTLTQPGFFHSQR